MPWPPAGRARAIEVHHPGLPLAHVSAKLLEGHGHRGGPALALGDGGLDDGGAVPRRVVALAARGAGVHQRAARVDGEVEVALAGVACDEELHAVVLPHGPVAGRAVLLEAGGIALRALEGHVEMRRIEEQTSGGLERPRLLRRALAQFQRRALLPQWRLERAVNLRPLLHHHRLRGPPLRLCPRGCPRRKRGEECHCHQVAQSHLHDLRE